MWLPEPYRGRSICLMNMLDQFVSALPMPKLGDVRTLLSQPFSAISPQGIDYKEFEHSPRISRTQAIA